MTPIYANCLNPTTLVPKIFVSVNCAIPTNTMHSHSGSKHTGTTAQLFQYGKGMVDLSEESISADAAHVIVTKAGLQSHCRLLMGEITDSAFENGLQSMASLLITLQDPALVEDYGWWLIQQDETIGLKVTSNSWKGSCYNMLRLYTL